MLLNQPRVSKAAFALWAVLSVAPHTAHSKNSTENGDVQIDAAGTIPDADTELDSESESDALDNETIVVTGSRRARPLKETTTATEVISREDIINSGAEDLSGLLAHHPGLDVRPSFRGSEVRMQGLSSTYVLILVDGERTLGRIGGAIDLQRFPAHSIERIEIVKGPSSALYGSDALAGVINIITKKPKDALKASLHSSMGQLGRNDLTLDVEAKQGRWSSVTSAGWHTSSGYDRDPSTLTTTSSSFDERTAKQSLRFKLRDSLAFTASADYLLRDQEGIDESGTGAVFDRTSRTEIAGVSMGVDWRAQDGGHLVGTSRVSMWNDQLLRDQRLSDDLDSYEATQERLGEFRVQYDRAIGATHFVTTGSELLLETLSADRITGRGSRYRGAVFATDEWTPSTKPYLVVAPGIRADIDSQFGSRVTPKLGVRYDVAEDVALRASYGQGFRAPNFRELLLFFENPSVGYRVLGNEDLRPENSHGLNASVQAKLANELWGTLSGFYNDIDNLITTDLVSAPNDDEMQVFGYVNIDSARTTGVEARLKASPFTGVTLDAGYTFTSTLNRSTGLALPGRARHQGTLRASYQPKAIPLKIAMRGGIYGPRIFFEGEETRTAPSYADLSTRISAEVASYLSVFAGFDNLLNAGDATLNPIPPRTFYGGMTARY